MKMGPSNATLNMARARLENGVPGRLVKSATKALRVVVVLVFFEEPGEKRFWARLDTSKASADHGSDRCVFQTGLCPRQRHPQLIGDDPTSEAKIPNMFEVLRELGAVRKAIFGFTLQGLGGTMSLRVLGSAGIRHSRGLRFLLECASRELRGVLN